MFNYTVIDLYIQKSNHIVFFSRTLMQLTELETEFENLPAGAPKQTRFLRSQQELKLKAEAAGEEGGEG